LSNIEVDVREEAAFAYPALESKGPL